MIVSKPEDPGTGGTDPGTGGEDPGTDPGTGGTDPGTGGTNPGTDPGTGGSEPSTGGGSGGSSGGGGGSAKETEVKDPVTPPTAGGKAPFKKGVKVKQHINGYVKGYEDGSFRPNNHVSRAELTQMLANIIEERGNNDVNCADIDGKWYTDAVEKILSLGIISGYPDGTFRPNEKITRQELVVALFNMLDISGIVIEADSGLTDISDVYGKEAIEYLYSMGIINGYPDGTFRPNAPVSRAEAIAMINRLLDHLIAKNTGKSVNLTDTENSWAKEEIERAYQADQNKQKEYKSHTQFWVWLLSIPKSAVAAGIITDTIYKKDETEEE